MRSQKVVALKVPAEEVAPFSSVNKQRTASRAITAVLKGLRTFFGLPQPVRDALERDMKTLKINSREEYFAWLLLERFHKLSSNQSKAPRSSDEAA